VVGLPDPLMGKESELFRVGLKNSNNLEKGLVHPNLGKRTITVFLEQIDDVTAYPRHNNHKTNENLGDFLDAVTDIHQHCQGRKEGVKDIGWKVISRNAMEYMKNSDELSVALSHLLEEQHTIFETYQEDFESVLVNAQVDEYTATNVVPTSLGIRIVQNTLYAYIFCLPTLLE